MACTAGLAPWLKAAEQKSSINIEVKKLTFFMGH
jgi:hypothetical protein